MTQETVLVQFDGREFEIIAASTVRQDYEIQRLAEEIAGGKEFYEHAVDIAEKSYDDYSKAMRKAMPNFAELDARLYELVNKNKRSDDEEIELTQLYQNLKNNTKYARYLRAREAVNAALHAATLEVLTVKHPEDFSWRTVDSETVKEIHREYMRSRAFFRTQGKQHAKNPATTGRQTEGDQ